MTPPLATVLLDPPTTFLAGAIISLIGTKLIRRSGAVEVWRSAVLGVAWSAVYGLAVGWMYFIRTDWMFVYLIDTAGMPLVPTYLAFLLILVAYGFAGALAAGHLVQTNRFGAAVGLTVAAAFTLVMLFVLTGAHYVVIGTTREYWAGTAKRLVDDAEAMRAVNGITVGTIVGTLPILFLRIRDLRRA
ncbi:MAG: hypothetical protein INH41_11940 [Myxococcaceae bacterium]|jgi:hypothetical protein|nr:hypothetical protein [Myxococcaceae bacterium]